MNRRIVSNKMCTRWVRASGYWECFGSVQVARRSVAVAVWVRIAIMDLIAEPRVLRPMKVACDVVAVKFSVPLLITAFPASFAITTSRIFAVLPMLRAFARRGLKNALKSTDRCAVAMG